MRKAPLADRIDAALGGKSMSFFDLARALYPPDSKAWRYAAGGGPPGCFMALSSGLRRGGFSVGSGIGPGNRIVYPRTKAPR